MASIPNTTPISAPIAPRDSRHRYPTHIDTYGLGGYRSVLSISDRDSIPGNRKQNGMLVYVVEEDKTYILKENLWEEVKVKITVQSTDETATFDTVNKLKIDTDSGLGLSEFDDETVIISQTKPFTELTDSYNNSIEPVNSQSVNFNETSTVIPKIDGNNINFNTKTFNYRSTSPSVSHTIVHNLGTNILIANIYLVNDTAMDFVILPYTINDLNTITVNLTVSRNIMVNIIPLEPL